MKIIKNILRGFTWWHSQTLNTQFFTWRKGIKVGQDKTGNIFYTSKDGIKRWVIFSGDAEASHVSPEWHGWLHHTWNELPTERPLIKQKWELDHISNMTGTVKAYAPTGSIKRSTPEPRQDYEAWRPQ